MKPQQRQENPRLQEIYVQSYDGGDNAYPILAIKYEPKSAGYKLPSAYDHFTDINALAKYPNHVFVGATPMSDSDQRVEHIYMILPGPWLLTSKLNEHSGDIWPMRKRHNAGGNIVVSAAIVSGSISATEREDITDCLSWEVEITIPQSQYFSEATALVTTEPGPYTFPGRINLTALDYFGTAIGYKKPYADIVPITKKEWWVIAASQPAFSFSPIIPQTVGYNGQTYDNVLVNAYTRLFGGLPCYQPPSTPTFDEFTGGQTIATLTFTNGSAAVVGTGTHFLTDFVVGQDIYGYTVGPLRVQAIIAGITDDTHLTLTAGFTGATGSGYYYLTNENPSVGWIGKLTVVRGQVEAERYGLLFHFVEELVEMR